MKPLHLLNIFRFGLSVSLFLSLALLPQSAVTAAVNPALVTISKNFSPDPAFAGGVTRLTYTITNPNDEAVSGVTFTDPLPASPGAMVVAAPPDVVLSGCGTAAFTPSAGSAVLSFSGGSIAMKSACVVSVNITVPSTGLYTSTSGHVFLDAVDTGNFAADTLTVNPLPPPAVCRVGTELAFWTFTGADYVSLPHPVPDFRGLNVATALASEGAPVHAYGDIFDGNGLPSLRLLDWPTTTGAINPAVDPYFQFEIDTSDFTSVWMNFDASRTATGPSSLYLYTSPDGTAWTLNSTFADVSVATFTAYSTRDAATTGTRYFRIYGNGATDTGTGAYANIDNVYFRGCSTQHPPTITKTFSPDPVEVGGVSTLTFTVTNPNYFWITDIAFTDELPAGLKVADPPAASTTCVNPPDFAPAAGDTILSFGAPTKGHLESLKSCTVQVNVTSDSTGVHTNVSGYVSSYTSINIGATGFAAATLTVNPLPDIVLTLEKTASPATYGAANEVISYTYVLTNDGTAALIAPFTVDDDKAAVTCPDSPTSLEPGDSITCTAAYTVAPTDLTAGRVTNTATGHAFHGTAAVNSNISAATVYGRVGSASLILEKTASPLVYDTLGGNIAYRYRLINNGNVPLTAPFTVDDDKVTVTCPGTPTSLNVGESLTCTAGYAVALSDLDAGSITNSATAHGFNGVTPVSSSLDSLTVTADQNPSILLTVTANPITYDSVGDLISYSYLVANTGNVTLAGPFSVTDNLVTVSCPFTASLVPGASISCSASYAVTQADLDGRTVINTATATNGTVTSPSDSAIANAVRNPALSLDKTAYPLNYQLVGNVISYSYLVTNTGNLTLTGPFTVSDNKVTTSCPSVSSLAPGASFTCAASYAVTQADMDAGSVTNTAVAGNNAVSAPVDSATVIRTANPSPVITQLNYTNLMTGSDAITLIIDGTGFLDGAQVYWNGAARATTFVSAVRLTAAIPAADLAAPGANAVTAVNPDSGGIPSNVRYVNVHTFADSTPANWHWKWVEGFYAKRITGGCDINPFRYCPDRAVTRAEMAVFILKALNVNTPGYAPDPAQTGIFADVPVAGKEWMQAWIEEFYEQGITGGCNVNPFRYCPERQVTRGEMAVFILKAVHGPSYTPPAATGVFADVPVAGKEWMQPWIEQYYREGITGGCNVNPFRYCPERAVTRAEMATFIDRAFSFPQVP